MHALPFSYPFVEGAPTSTNSKPHQNAKDHTPHTENLQKVGTPRQSLSKILHCVVAAAVSYSENKEISMNYIQNNDGMHEQ